MSTVSVDGFDERFEQAIATARGIEAEASVTTQVHWTLAGELQACDSQRVYWRAEARKSTAEVSRLQRLWEVQSAVIKALAAEVPDEVRARVLAPIKEATR